MEFSKTPNYVTDSQLVYAAEDVDPPASINQQLELPFDGKSHDRDDKLNKNLSLQLIFLERSN